MPDILVEAPADMPTDPVPEDVGTPVNETEPDSVKPTEPVPVADPVPDKLTDDEADAVTVPIEDVEATPVPDAEPDSVQPTAPDADVDDTPFIPVFLSRVNEPVPAAARVPDNDIERLNDMLSTAVDVATPVPVAEPDLERPTDPVT